MPEPAAFERIMVAVGDGSRAAQLVVSVAGLASAGAADVLLVYVSDCSVCCGATDHPALHEHERELLQSLVDGLCARGVRARSELLRYGQRTSRCAPARRRRGLASRPAGRRRRPAWTSPRAPVAARAGEAAE